MNNGYVLITMIGEGEGEALLCFTDDDECCNSTKIQGKWYSPNNQSTVGVQADGNDFYFDRGPSVVRLHRRNNATMPTGLFCCEVPDVTSTNMTMCTNIGELHLHNSQLDTQSSRKLFITLSLFSIGTSNHNTPQLLLSNRR